MSKKEKYAGPERRGNGGWHLDRRVPIALIAVLVGQAFVFGFWGATLESQVGHNKDAIAALSSTGERLARIETKLETLVNRWARGSRRTGSP